MTAPGAAHAPPSESRQPLALRIFLDANVLFSAARASGAMRQLLLALHAQGHVLVVDTYVCTEAQRNLAAKAGAQALLDLDAILPMLETSGAKRSLSAAAAQAAQWLPEKDRPVLLAAIALRCDALVTGDKTHFGAGYGQHFEGVTLYSPAQLALAVFPPRTEGH